MMTTARKDRMWIIAGVVAALVLAGASWFFLIGPKLDDAASVRSDAAAAADQNDVLQIKVNKLRADSANLPDLVKTLNTLHTQLPTTLQLDEFTRQLTAQAKAAKVTMKSIVVGGPTAVKATTSTPAPASTAADGTPPDDGSDPSTTDAAEGSDGDAPTGAPVAPSPAASAGTLYAVPVTISADGPLVGQRMLLAAIQTQGPRGALVSSVQFSASADATPGGTGKSGRSSDEGDGAAKGADPTSMTVQLTVFVAPQSPDDEAALRKQLGG